MLSAIGRDREINVDFLRGSFLFRRLLRPIRDQVFFREGDDSRRFRRMATKRLPSRDCCRFGPSFISPRRESQCGCRISLWLKPAEDDAAIGLGRNSWRETAPGRRRRDFTQPPAGQGLRAIRMAAHNKATQTDRCEHFQDNLRIHGIISVNRVPWQQACWRGNSQAAATATRYRQ